jgi:hypothetical protein
VRWNRRVVTGGAVFVTVAAFVLAVVVAIAWFRTPRPTRSECRITVGTSRYVIDLEQAASATTITAVGKRLGLPDHAVTIALAAALQESRLRNLAYGDRDSLGLFQQRPSQGWGTAAQVMTPRYAAAAFYKALARIPDWQTRSVTSAAQAVQRSGAPQAYASWEPLARDLAIATTGEASAGLTCQFAPSHSKTPPASPVPTLMQELGPSTLGAPVSPTRGWTIASWLVGHAAQFRISSVRFAAREWTPKGKWSASGANEPGVRITQG